MTNYKVITNNDDNKSPNTENPAKNRKRHTPAKGFPRV